MHHTTARCGRNLTPCMTGRRRAKRDGNPTATPLGAPVDADDTDMRPRVLPGLVTSIHHRKRRRMLHASQARLITTPCEEKLRSAVESVVLRCQCMSACAAAVFMAGCGNAPHPAMSERIGKLARLKGALRRAAPALDPRQLAMGALHVPRVQRACPPALHAQGAKPVRPPFPAGLVGSSYHPKGVSPDTCRKGGLR